MPILDPMHPARHFSNRHYAASGGSLTAGYNCRFEADSLGLSNGTKATQLTDLSGNGNHATQSNSTLQGTCVTAALNGHSVIHFPNAPFYKTASAVSVGTMFVVCNHLDGTIFTDYRRVFDADDSSGWSLFGVNGQNYYNPGNSSFLRNMVTTQFWINGSLATSLTPLSNYRLVSVVFSPTNPTNHVICVGSTLNPGQYLYGNIAEYVFYPTALSDHDRIASEGYLRTKYGLP